MQVIKYKWLTSEATMEPFLFVKDKEIERIALFDQKLSFTLGKRMCIGYFKNGKHMPCPYKRVVDTGHCNECKLHDDFFFCIKCTGEECINEKQRGSCKENSYFVYLAAFNSILKVGISYQFRLLERLIEQGADFAAKIAVVKDGKDVRSVEQEIKNYLQIVDRVVGNEKHKMLFCNPNIAVANIFNAINSLKNNGVSKHMIHPEV
ncbi:MAG: DUF2797 domain-containing protein, partial [Candidatus Aenigmarchaeota archaeon]|nr:DUF2797 domain-containing protein [Candidatus Aenigmarchaeota archaeon]